MGLSLGRRSDTARCAGCQRRGEALTLLGNGTSYCPSCAERVRKLLGFGPDVDDEILEPDELPDGEPIVALGFEPADETPAAEVSSEQIAEPELAESWSPAASAETPDAADETADEVVTGSESPVITGPWAVPALDASDAEDDAPEQSRELDAATPQETVAEHPWQHDEEPQQATEERSPEQAPDLDAATPQEAVAEHPWQHDEEPQQATDDGSPLSVVVDEHPEHAPVEHEVVAQAAAPSYGAGSFGTSRLGPVDPSGDPAAGTLAAIEDDDEASDAPASDAPQESTTGYQLDHEQDEPKESAMVAMESDEDAYEAGDGAPVSTDGGGLGSALHEEHRRLVARRADVERRIEEATSEIEAITRRVELVEALLAEESAAA
jgi:hypothetical protein